MTPCMALLGYELPKPKDWTLPKELQPNYSGNSVQERSDRNAQIVEHQAKYQEKYAPRRSPVPIKLNIGNLVMVKDNRQLKHPFDARWSGPHEIVGTNGDVTYNVRREGKIINVHIDDIRLAPTNNVITPTRECKFESSPQQLSLEISDNRTITEQQDTLSLLDNRDTLQLDSSKTGNRGSIHLEDSDEKHESAESDISSSSNNNSNSLNLQVSKIPRRFVISPMKRQPRKKKVRKPCTCCD